MRSMTDEGFQPTPSPGAVPAPPSPKGEGAHSEHKKAGGVATPGPCIKRNATHTFLETI